VRCGAPKIFHLLPATLHPQPLGAEAQWVAVRLAGQVAGAGLFCKVKSKGKYFRLFNNLS